MRWLNGCVRKGSGGGRGFESAISALFLRVYSETCLVGCGGSGSYLSAGNILKIGLAGWVAADPSCKLGWDPHVTFW